MAQTPRKHAWERKAAPELRYADEQELRRPEPFDREAFFARQEAADAMRTQA